MKPARVLILSPIASHPATQGNSARIQTMGRELMRRGIGVDFFYYGMEGLSQDQAHAMRGFWSGFFFMKSLPNKRQSLPGMWGLDDWCPDELCEEFARTAAARPYDAVIVNYVWMSKVLDRIDGPLKLIDTHDLFGDRQRVAQAAGIEPRWFFTSPREEECGFARADIVIGIQSEETDAIRKRHDGAVLTVGHPLEPHFLSARRNAKPFFTFGYLGSANPFNIASINALDDALYGSDIANWAIAGSICARRLVLRSQPTRLGLVDRLSDFYDNVECVLNPMVGGTGLKIKTIEALSFGVAVIGTRDAFAGLPRRHAYHGFETIDEMAQAMRDYLRHESVRSELRQESLRLFADYMADVARGYDRLVATLKNGTLSHYAA